MTTENKPLTTNTYKLSKNNKGNDQDFSKSRVGGGGGGGGGRGGTLINGLYKG